MKKAFSLFETIIVVSILILIATFSNLKLEDNSLDNLTNRLVLYLKQTRYQSLIEEQESKSENLWHKKRWTFKFFRCRKDVGGLYYVIYSDKNKTGHPSSNESMNDPLTNKKIYSSNKCEENSNNSKYVLLTKEFDVDEVNITCNKTNSLGQISFGSKGKVYSKLSSFENESYEYEITKACEIEIKSYKKGSRVITIEPKTCNINTKKKP